MNDLSNSLVEAVDVTVDALEYTHPTAIISTHPAEPCDIRVEPVSDGILVTAYEPYSITDEDITTILNSSLNIGSGVGEEFVLITRTRPHIKLA